MHPVAVIGSNSFSGASFIAYLLERGCDVLGISRSPEAPPALLPYKWPDSQAVKGRFLFRQLDLNRDVDEIDKALRDFQPRYIFNFAAQSMVAESWEHPDQWYTTNVVSSSRLFEKLRRLTFLQKYVHVSTPEVYGNCVGMVHEDAPFNPSTPYAISKAACDFHLNALFRNYKFPVAFTRAANVYGPGQQLYRIIPRTILSIKTGKKLPLHGGGASVRSFIHIRDVAEATLLIAERATPPNCYHLATSEYVSIRKLVETICELMHVDFASVVDVVDERPGKDAAYKLASDKIEKNLGWRANISLAQGLDETVSWVDRYFDELKQMPMNYVHKA